MSSSRVILAAVVLLLAACSPAPSEAPPASRPVKTLVVVAEPIDRVSQYAGEVRARYEISLAFRVGGKIIERQAEIGQQVEADQTLMQLDSGDLALNQQALRAQLTAAEADRDQAQSKLNRAKALLADFDATLARVWLVKPKRISIEDLVEDIPGLTREAVSA